MSMESKEKMTCPGCNTVGEFTIRRSINTVMDPEMKQKVRDRSAFAYTCPHCHKTFDVDYGFLYHQMEDRIMIHYCQDEKTAEEALHFYAEAGSAEDSIVHEVLNDGYIHRVVMNRNDLLEKLNIFDQGLDDRISELVKAIYHLQLTNDPAAKDLVTIRIDEDDDGMILVLFDRDDQVFGTVPVAPEIWEQIASDFGDTLPPIREDRNVVVNFNWAVEQLSRKQV